MPQSSITLRIWASSVGWFFLLIALGFVSVHLLRRTNKAAQDKAVSREHTVPVQFHGLPAKLTSRLAVERLEMAPGLPARCPDFEKA
jgi:hypothetical protein